MPSNQKYYAILCRFFVIEYPKTMLYLTLFGSWFVALLLLLWAGWGLAQLLTPPDLHAVQPLLMPFFGYALVSLSAYYLLWIGIALDSGRWIVLALAGGINGLAWRTRGRRTRVQPDRAALGVAAALGLGAGIVAVLPLFFHGLLAPIGASWDVEFYLPLATYLRQFKWDFRTADRQAIRTFIEGLRQG